METMDLYPTIFKRKSIRNYDPTPLNQNVMETISNKLQNLKPLNKDIKTEFKVITSDQVKNLIMKKAPYYVAAFSEPKDNYLLNVGFMLQHVDLFLSANDVGSCWQAAPKPSKEVMTSSNLEFVILMAFGKAKEALHRGSISDFKRKSLLEITGIKDADELLEAARLAPSTANSQTWYFTGDKNMIHICSGKPSFITGLFAKKYLPIDTGIAICHLQIAAEHFGKEATIVTDKKAEAKPPKDFEYVASLKIE